MNKIENLMDAIVAYTNYSNPESLQYQYRNPLGLQMFCTHAQPLKVCPQCCTITLNSMVHPYDSGTVVTRRWDPTNGMRIFESHVQGYQSGLHDLQLKCSGKSKSKVKKTSSIKELVRSYYLPDGTASYCAKFLRRALKDESITENTPIEYFVNEKTETKETVNAA